MTMDKGVLQAGIQHFPSIHQSRESLKLSCASFNLRCLPCQLSTFSPSPLSHWGHKRPPGSKRAPASRKAWCPPQAATKQRTFHGGGWKPNQTIKISEKHSNTQLFRTSQQPALQHLDGVVLGMVTLRYVMIRYVPDLGPTTACKHSPPLLVNPDSENRSFPVIVCKFNGKLRLDPPGQHPGLPVFGVGVELAALPIQTSTRSNDEC